VNKLQHKQIIFTASKVRGGRHSRDYHPIPSSSCLASASRRTNVSSILHFQARKWNQISHLPKSAQGLQYVSLARHPGAARTRKEAIFTNQPQSSIRGQASPYSCLEEASWLSKRRMASPVKQWCNNECNARSCRFWNGYGEYSYCCTYNNKEQANSTSKPGHEQLNPGSISCTEPFARPEAIGPGPGGGGVTPTLSRSNPTPPSTETNTRKDT